MQRKKLGVDIIKDILVACLESYPTSTFVSSLSAQYEERGFLTKKQLEGLYQKSQSLSNISVGKLATLEAIIAKMPTRYKSAMPVYEPLYLPDTAVGEQIAAILYKYPQHKRVVFFQTKYNNNEVFSSSEKTELEKFFKLLLK
jgi:hypothetical protein